MFAQVRLGLEICGPSTPFCPSLLPRESSEKKKKKKIKYIQFSTFLKNKSRFCHCKIENGSPRSKSRSCQGLKCKNRAF